MPEPAKACAERQQLQQLTRIARQRIRRDIVEDRLDEPRHFDHRLAVLVVGLGIEPGVARDLAARHGVVVGAPQVVAVGRREGAIERQNLQTVPRQLQLANDLRPQQRHHVGTDRDVEPREHFLGDRRAADDMPALEHQHPPPGARQVGSGGQPVVSAADHDRVVVHV